MIVTLGPDFERRMAELDVLTIRMEAVASECERRSELLTAPPKNDLEPECT